MTYIIILIECVCHVLKVTDFSFNAADLKGIPVAFWRCLCCLQTAAIVFECCQQDQLSARNDLVIDDPPMEQGDKLDDLSRSLSGSGAGGLMVLWQVTF